MIKFFFSLALFLHLFGSVEAQQDSLMGKPDSIHNTISGHTQIFKVVGKATTGSASVFSSKADGFKTASGEKFSNADFTIATNAFKLNTRVKVTNLSNKKTVFVRVNDRISGKKKAPVMIMSRAAAKVLDFLKTGNTKIKVEQIVLINSNSIDSSNVDTLYKAKLPAPVVENIRKESFIRKGKKVTGIASFYSANLDGSITATGERYRNNLLTAASNNFKLNTWVLVTNLRNKQTVIVRINDRMHPRMKKKGRVVDLSRLAARQLNFMYDGLTRVTVETIEFIPYVDSVRLPTDIKVIDTITGGRDSVLQADSVVVDSVRADRDTVFGIASFYSSNLDGSKTATGEIYRNHKMSAASNNFKLNTWVRVTNLKNNKSIILRINDRMHKRMQQKGRVVDLSRIAANRLDFIKKGLTSVRVEVVAKGTLE